MYILKLHDRNLLRQGQVSVVGVMVILMVTVILATTVYYWGISMVTGSQTGMEAPIDVNIQRLSEDLTIEAVEFTSESVKIHIANVGVVDLTVNAVYINNERYSLTQAIKPGEKETITVSIAWDPEETYHIVLATLLGNTYETYVRAPSAAGWLEEWSYRKSHEIQGSTAGSVTDYQVKIVVHYGSGSDSGENVYLNNHAKTDFGDVRFTHKDGSTELFYWMEEKVDGNYAVFWVKVPSIPSNPNSTTIYIYYGKSDASTTSNGLQTFVFFDDFTSLDPDIWYVVANDYSVSGGVLRINVGAVGLRNPLSYRLQDGYIVEAKTMFNVYASLYSGTVPEVSSSRFTASGNNREDATVLYMRGNNSRYLYYWIGDGSEPRYNVASGVRGWLSSEGVWYKTAVSIYGGTVRLWKDYSVQQTYNGIDWNKDIKYFSLGAFHGSRFYNIQDTSYDWVRIRKYVEPEPTHGSWGPEETP